MPADRCSALTSNVVAFVHSASVNLTRWSGKPEERDKEWEKLMKSDSFIHIVFTKPAKISLMRADHQGREEKSVSQILITLPPNQWPSVCVKSDGTVICFTKYDPFVLKELVSEPALGLSSVPRDGRARDRDQPRRRPPGDLVPTFGYVTRVLRCSVFPGPPGAG